MRVRADITAAEKALAQVDSMSSSGVMWKGVLAARRVLARTRAREDALAQRLHALERENYSLVMRWRNTRQKSNGRSCGDSITRSNARIDRVTERAPPTAPHCSAD